MEQITSAHTRDHYRGPLHTSEAGHERRAPRTSETGGREGRSPDQVELSQGAQQALADLDQGLSVLLAENPDIAFPEEGSSMSRINGYLTDPWEAQRALSDPRLGNFYSSLQNLQRNHRKALALSHQVAVNQLRPEGYWSNLY